MTKQEFKLLLKLRNKLDKACEKAAIIQAVKEHGGKKSDFFAKYCGGDDEMSEIEVYKKDSYIGCFRVNIEDVLI